MSDAGRPDGPADHGEPAAGGPAGDPHHEPVGSVGEEAAKLFGALSDWARTQGVPGAAGAWTGEPAGGRARERVDDASGDTAGSANPAAQAREALAQGLHEVGEHLATGSAECRYCPVCQVIHVVRQTSPEVRAHLTAAAGSLLQAAAGLMAPPPPPSGARGPVERIDLDGEPDATPDPRPAGASGADDGWSTGSGPEVGDDEQRPGGRR